MYKHNRQQERRLFWTPTTAWLALPLSELLLLLLLANNQPTYHTHYWWSALHPRLLMAYLSFRSPPRPKSLRRKESRVFDASEDRYRRVFPPGGARRWPKVGVSWKDRPDDALVAISNNVGSSGW
jgi:hypothetical protein